MAGVDLVDHGLVVDAYDTPDAAEVSAFEVEPDGFPPCLFRVAERLRVGRVDALKLLASIMPAARAGIAGFSLLPG